MRFWRHVIRPAVGLKIVSRARFLAKYCEFPSGDERDYSGETARRG